jgi:hypothetical protein
MARITFQKRQKEMKRLEKQRMKAERRAQRKLAKGAEPDTPEQLEGVPAQPELQGQDSLPDPQGQGSS